MNAKVLYTVGSGDSGPVIDLDKLSFISNINGAENEKSFSMYIDGQICNMSMIVNPEKDSSADEAAFNETRKALIEAWNEYRYNKKISESVKETNKMMSDKNFRLLLSRIAEEHEKLADQRTRLACGR